MSELVLSLFPGADLFGRAFELQGCCVVRGPDLLFGHDIRNWTPPDPGGFEGIIGGPPCQTFSQARRSDQAARHDDLVPIFWALVRDVRPEFAVMENVLAVRGHKAIPWSAKPIVLTDWDCGGFTHRTRVFYVWPEAVAKWIALPPRRPGRRGGAALSVLASSHRGTRHRVTAEVAANLQGWPEIYATLQDQADEGEKGNRLVPKRLITHMLGNGVPRSMGAWIAREVMRATRSLQLGGLSRAAGERA